MIIFCWPYDVDGKRNAICDHVIAYIIRCDVVILFDMSGLHDAIAKGERFRMEEVQRLSGARSSKT
jgi:hypothetical protein